MLTEGGQQLDGQIGYLFQLLTSRKPAEAELTILRKLYNDQAALFALAARHGVQVRHLRPSIPTLEDVFAKALGEK